MNQQQTQKTMAVVSQNEQPLSAGQLLGHLDRVRDLQRAVMKPNVHYMTIPGTKQPTLLKSGAEALCAAFRIAPEFDVEDLGTADSVRYRVRCKGSHQATGILLGEGMGECSSQEEKFRWRAPVCQAEFDAMPQDRRRLKFYRNGKQVNQVATEPADQGNTVLKMACKRAQIHMTLNVLAASDLFLAEGDGGEREIRSTPNREAPRSTAAPAALTAEQVSLLTRKCNDGGVDVSELCARFEVGSLAEISFGDVNAALQAIDEMRLE